MFEITDEELRDIDAHLKELEKIREKRTHELFFSH